MEPPGDVERGVELGLLVACPFGASLEVAPIGPLPCGFSHAGEGVGVFHLAGDHTLTDYFEAVRQEAYWV